jgi:hypothetical protein
MPVPIGMRQRASQSVRADRVVATKPKGALTFYANGVARFTFLRREDRFDRSNKLVGG